MAQRDLERIARNEATFRRVNEAIERGRSAGGRDLVGFICECGRLSCNEVVELTVPEYEAVRTDFDRFLLVPGHELPDVEDLVESHPRYAVVAKRAEGAAVADATDPRTQDVGR